MSDVPAQRLEDLVGEHVLDYVPRLDVRHPIDSDAAGCLFGIDGWSYLAFEDPSDGYRSSLGALLAFRGEPYQLGGSFWPEHLAMRVLCSMEGDGGEVLTMRDVATGRVVFEVGTDHADDYYPSYVARWTPPAEGTEAAGSEGEAEAPGGPQ